MIIERLEPSKRVKGRWLVFGDDERILRVGEEEIITFSLHKGRDISEEEIAQLSASAHVNQAKKKAIETLMRRQMSQYELMKKLEFWEVSPAQSEEICQRMLELHLLDDARYAQTVAKHYSEKGFGAAKIRDELYRRGIDRQLWDEAMMQQDNTQSAIAAFLEKKLKTEKPDPRQLKKVTDALLRRGFSWHEIQQEVARYGVAAWED